MRRAGTLCLVVALAGCGSGAKTTTSVTTGVPTVEKTGPVAAHVRHVVVRETEFRLDPVHALAGQEGLVSIKIVNHGHIAHALAVDGPNGEVEFDGQVDPGHTGTLQVDLDKPGTYTMFCPLDGHRAKGMEGTITVGGSQPARAGEPAGSTTTTSTQTAPTQTQTQTQTVTSSSHTTPTTTRTHTVTTTTSTSSSGNGY